MAKNIRRMFAMCMVLCMLLTAVPLQALAEETVETSTDRNDGVATSVTTTTTTTTSGDNTTVTIKVDKTTSGTKESNGDTVSGRESSTSTTVKDSQDKVIASSNQSSSVNTTVTTTPNAAGGNTTVETTEIKNSREEINGDSHEFEVTRTETTDTNANGDVIREQWEVDGSEKSKEHVAPNVNVDVSLTDKDDPETEEKENQNTVLGDAAGTDKTDANAPDGTTSTVDKQGSVTVTTNDVTITESNKQEETDLEYVKSETTPDGTNDLIKENASAAPDEYLPGSNVENPTIPESDYEFVIAGTGNTSQFRPAIVFTEPLSDEDKVKQYGDHYKDGAYIHINYLTNTFVRWLDDEYEATVAKDENGNYVTDEGGYILDIYGNRVLKQEKTMVGPDGETYYLHRFDNTGNGNKVEGWYKDGEWIVDLNGASSAGIVWAGAQQFVLVDTETGEIVTTYCVDVATRTQENFGYTMENLEDADYYTEEQAKHIRAIAQNGYWGTVGTETDEDGNTVPKAGSLEAMKQQLLASGQFTEEELNSLTDGVALTATQMAIWSFSNKMAGTEFVNTHYFGGIGETETDATGLGGNLPTSKEDEAKLMFKIYEYLVNLEAVEAEKTTAETVINAGNFLKDMSVTVIEKDESHSNNYDGDKDNDAYVTKLTFALIVTPSTENGDNLKVTVVNSAGEEIAVGRIAGEAQEGETILVPDENGNYTFENISLVEGDQSLKLNLDGVQNLKEGIYLYSSEVVDGVSSQTMVGMASGEHGVDVSMDLQFSLSVDDEVIVRERVWHDEGDPSYDPPSNPPYDPPTPPTPPTDPEEDPEEDEPVPAEYRMTNQDDGATQTIDDEPVPLADAPKTGDESGMIVAMIIMLAMSLFVVNYGSKKFEI